MSVVAIGVVVLRMRYPDIFKLDAISVVLIVLAILPWLRSIVKSVEVAGLGKLELQDVENAARRVEGSGLPKPDPSEPAVQGTSTANGSAGAADSDAEVAQRQGDPMSEWPAAEAALDIVHSLPKRTAQTPIGVSIGKSAAALLNMQPFGFSSTDLTYADARLGGAAILFTRSLRRLADEFGVAYTSSEDTIARLFGVGAIDVKQADALVTASSLLRAARGLEASGLAVQKTLDVVMNVVQSLEVLREKEHSRRTRVSAGTTAVPDQPSGKGSTAAAGVGDAGSGTEPEAER
ncbi:hypothetical protein [Stenotrophomonas sp. ATs4]|uniref:hypothetical protein n=1 Tax=Stenotrophomonas sp. ATs4 TaxID=3402766 RepID=UPI003F7228DD